MPPRSANKAFSRPSTVALNALALESLAWVDLMFRSVSVILGRLELRQDGRASGRFDLDRLPVEQCDEVVDDVGSLLCLKRDCARLAACVPPAAAASFSTHFWPTHRKKDQVSS
jgi:hypothetical protein